MNKVNEATKLLTELAEKIKTSIEGKSIQKLTPQQMCAEVLFTDIFYLAENCISILEKNENILAIPMMVRGLFERYMDLVLLRFDDAYLKNIWLYAEEESLKYLNNLHDENKKDPSFDHGIKDIDDEIQKTKKSIQDLNSDGVKSFSFKAKLDEIKKRGIADFDRIYIYYRKLSAKTHSNLREMTIRYKQSQQRENSLLERPQFDESEYLVCANFIGQTLLYSYSDIMNLIYDIKDTDDSFVEITTKIKNLQKNS